MVRDWRKGRICAVNTAIQHSTGSLVSAVRQVKEKACRRSSGKIKLPISDDMLVCLQNPKESIDKQPGTAKCV